MKKGLHTGPAWQTPIKSLLSPTIADLMLYIGKDDERVQQGKNQLAALSWLADQILCKQVVSCATIEINRAVANQSTVVEPIFCCLASPFAGDASLLKVSGIARIQCFNCQIELF